MGYQLLAGLSSTDEPIRIAVDDLGQLITVAGTGAVELDQLAKLDNVASKLDTLIAKMDELIALQGGGS